MPYNKSSARSLIDSSLSSKHCITKSLCDCTVFGWVFKILDIANNPKYFTAWKNEKLFCDDNFPRRNYSFRWKIITYSFGRSLQLESSIFGHITETLIFKQKKLSSKNTWKKKTTFLEKNTRNSFIFFHLNSHPPPPHHKKGMFILYLLWNFGIAKFEHYNL